MTPTRTFAALSAAIAIHCGDAVARVDRPEPSELGEAVGRISYSAHTCGVDGGAIFRHASALSAMFLDSKTDREAFSSGMARGMSERPPRHSCDHSGVARVHAFFIGSMDMSPSREREAYDRMGRFAGTFSFCGFPPGINASFAAAAFSSTYMLTPGHLDERDALSSFSGGQRAAILARGVNAETYCSPSSHSGRLIDAMLRFMDDPVGEQPFLFGPK